MLILSTKHSKGELLESLDAKAEGGVSSSEVPNTPKEVPEIQGK